MADIFKLLSRSTKLQKHASTSLSESRLPSAGIPTHPHILAEADSRSHDAEDLPRGTKRKRKAFRLKPDENEEGPNFFELGVTGPAASTEQKSHLDQPVSGTSEGSSDPLTSNYTSMSPEERRRILKGHKLKITLMSHGTPAVETQGSRKRKHKLEAKTSQSQGFSPIFPCPLATFTQLRPRFRVSKRLVENIQAQGYKAPTEVQLGSLPILLGQDSDIGLPPSSSGKTSSSPEVDLLTIAPTGSGKTLAFLIPIIQRLVEYNHENHERGDATPHLKEHVKAIVVAPTHELVDQIVNEARKLLLGTGLKVAAMRKGMTVAQADSENPLENFSAKSCVKTDILVSTPLILLNSISQAEAPSKVLPSIRYLVLDEADVLLDPLFREQTLGIWMACTNPSLRVSFWSATIGSSIEDLARKTIAKRQEDLGIKEPQSHLVRLIAGLKDSALPSVSHKLVYAASEQGKLLAIRQLLHPSTALDSQVAALRPPFIVFTQTIPRATALHSELLYDIPIEAGGSGRIAVLHSSLSENARSDVMTGFRKGEIWIIITTDLLARGIDFRGVNGIVNYDIPNTAAAYVHRAGRTGRAGREGGIAVTLYTKEDIPYVKNVANVISASERALGKPNTESGVQQWLLDALPKVSKKDKQELKKKGVTFRRSDAPEGDSKEARKSRISTKSGFDRRLENKRKGVIAASKSRLSNESIDAVDDDGSEDEWEGLD